MICNYIVYGAKYILFMVSYNSADFIDICINRRHITGDNLNVLLMPVGFNEIDVFPLVIYATTSNVCCLENYFKNLECFIVARKI